MIQQIYPILVDATVDLWDGRLKLLLVLLPGSAIAPIVQCELTLTSLFLQGASSWWRVVKSSLPLTPLALTQQSIHSAKCVESLHSIYHGQIRMVLQWLLLVWIQGLWIMWRLKPMMARTGRNPMTSLPFPHFQNLSRIQKRDVLLLLHNKKIWLLPTRSCGVYLRLSCFIVPWEKI